MTTVANVGGAAINRDPEPPSTLTTAQMAEGYIAELVRTGSTRLLPLAAVRRHNAATLLLSMGVHPKIVSEMLGHTQIGVTLDLYSHVTATMQREAVEAFEELLCSS